MRRASPVLLLIPVILLLASCAPEPLKQSGMQGESAISLVRDLTGAYERKDLETFMDKVAPSFPDRDGFRKSLEKVFSSYQTIRQKIQYDRMLIMVPAKGGLRIVLLWEGEWQTAGGKAIKDGARSTLVLETGTFKLLGIEGKDPYLPVENPVPVRP